MTIRKRWRRDKGIGAFASGANVRVAESNKNSIVSQLNSIAALEIEIERKDTSRERVIGQAYICIYDVRTRTRRKGTAIVRRYVRATML